MPYTSVTHVPGPNCYLCNRAGPRLAGAHGPRSELVNWYDLDRSQLIAEFDVAFGECVIGHDELVHLEKRVKPNQIDQRRVEAQKLKKRKAKGKG